jgi:nitroreductase
MKFDDVILGRRSIRGYKSDPVPKALIAEIIGLAMLRSVVERSQMR